MEEWGDGARAIVRVEWESDELGGHVFIAEQYGGSTIFIDPQSGDADCSRYFDHVERDGTFCVRIDDKEITQVVEKAVDSSSLQN